MLMAKVRSSIFSVLLFCGANLGAQARSLQSEEQIIRSLQVGGRLEALAMKPTWDLYQDLTGCQKSELEIGQQMKPLCQVVVASKMCQEISPEDRLDCQTLEMEPQVGLWPFLAGCAQSLFKSVKDTLAFIWELVEWAFENISSEQARDQTSAQVKSVVMSNPLNFICIMNLIRPMRRSHHLFARSRH